MHYSRCRVRAAGVRRAFNIPVVETVAGKASLLAAHPLNAGPVGVTGCQSANALAADADVVIAVGSRLQDFTTGSWTGFARRRQVRRHQRRRLRRHQALVAAGRRRRPRGLAELTPLLGDWAAPDDWTERAARETQGYHAYIDKIAAADARTGCRPTPR